VLRPGGVSARGRAGRGVVWLCAALLALAPAASFGEDVRGDAALLAWRPAAGDVAVYVVFVSRDGGPFRSEQYTREPRVRVFGREGETVQVRVRAYGLAAGRVVTGPPSEASEVLRFLVPEERRTVAVSAPPPPPAPALRAEPDLPRYPPLPPGVDPEEPGSPP
jgi:hypothetical protein